MPNESSLIYLKSINLAETLIRNIKAIDHTKFPTSSSNEVKALLEKLLEYILSPEYHNLEVSPEVLYNRLINLQEYLDILNASATDEIPWQIVGFCDNIWKKLFPEAGPKVFYSVMKEHNYCIRNYTIELKRAFEPILSIAEINNIFGQQDYCCLSIPTLEAQNVPLYSIFGHEFGHIVFNFIVDDIESIFNGAYYDLFNDMIQFITITIRQTLEPFRMVITSVLSTIASELFSDLIGAKIFGPAYYLSFYELTWGTNKTKWNVNLNSDLIAQSTHPSINYRLKKIKAILKPEQYYDQTYLSDTPNEFRKIIVQTIEHILDIPIDTNSDSFLIQPHTSLGEVDLQYLFNEFIDQFQSASDTFIVGCNSFIEERFSDLHISEFKDVVKLMNRLNNDILPDSLPDSTHPNDIVHSLANFPTILNASALYRMCMLSMNDEDLNIENITEKLQKTERLTTKALQVVFVGDKYRKWDGR